MQTMDRRAMLREVLCGAAAAAVGVTLIADAGEATPLAVEKSPAGRADDLVEEAGWPGRWRGGPWRGGWRGGWRGRRCWWNRWGRRVCAW